nr:uncharacterized protein LOC111771102 isoform X1 [Equus caballus]
MLRAAPPAHACAAAGEAAGGRAVASARRGGAGQAGGGAPAAGFSGPPPACTAPGPPGPGALLPASRRRHLPGPLRPSPPPFEFLPDPARSGSPVSAAGPHPGSELEKVGVERWGRPRGEVRRARGDWWRTKIFYNTQETCNAGSLVHWRMKTWGIEMFFRHKLSGTESPLLIQFRLFKTTDSSTEPLRMPYR